MKTREAGSDLGEIARAKSYVSKVLANKVSNADCRSRHWIYLKPILV